MRVSRKHLFQLLTSNGFQEFGTYNDHELWVNDETGVVIRLPNTATIHIDLVEIIALEQLDMSMWEYDYWLGLIGFVP